MALYEMITVYRRAANYKLINNRISDTEYKFEHIFSTCDQNPSETSLHTEQTHEQWRAKKTTATK